MASSTDLSSRDSVLSRAISSSAPRARADCGREAPSRPWPLFTLKTSRAVAGRPATRGTLHPASSPVAPPLTGPLLSGSVLSCSGTPAPLCVCAATILRRSANAPLSQNARFRLTDAESIAPSPPRPGDLFHPSGARQAPDFVCSCALVHPESIGRSRRWSGWTCPASARGHRWRCRTDGQKLSRSDPTWRLKQVARRRARLSHWSTGGRGTHARTLWDWDAEQSP